MTVLASCATMGHDSLALTGRVSDRLEMGGNQASCGAYRPGMGGAVAALLVSAKSAAPDHFYEFQSNDRTTKSVPSREEYVVGDRLEVWVESSKSSLNNHLKSEDVALRSSTACQPQADPQKEAVNGAAAGQLAT